MTCATVLLFDDKVDSRIRAAWEQLAEAGISDSMLRPEFRPHLTLSAGSEFDTPKLVRELGEIAAATVACPIGLASLGVFADTGVVFLGVAPSESLLDLHRRVDRANCACGGTRNPWYQLGGWIPHVTLALGLDRDQMRSAVDLLMATNLKMVASAVAVLLIRGDETGWTVLAELPLLPPS